MADPITCELHGALTHISCATCGKPICPRCLVRTPVGFKCRACTSRTGHGHQRHRWLRAVAVVVLAAGVIALPTAVRLISQRGGDPQPPAASSATAGAGDEVRDAGLTFVVRSFACETGTDSQVCRMQVAATNHGSGPEELLGRLQFLVDGVGRRYGPEEGLELFSEELNPGEEGELRLIFDIPLDVTVDEAELHTYPGSLGARVDLVPPLGNAIVR